MFSNNFALTAATLAAAEYQKSTKETELAELFQKWIKYLEEIDRKTS